MSERQKNKRKNNKNNGLRKVCGCSRRAWAKCPHPWHFLFMWNGTDHRYSLDRLLGRRLAGKTEAQTVADDLRAKIRAGAFPAPAAPVTAAPAAAITVRRLLEKYRDSKTWGPKRVKAFDSHIKTITETNVPTPAGAIIAFGDWAANDVTLDALEQLRDFLAMRGRTGANRHLGQLRAAFGWGAGKRRRFVEESPFSDGDRAADFDWFDEHPRTRRLQPGEGDRLLAACKDHLYAVVFTLL